MIDRKELADAILRREAATMQACADWYEERGFVFVPRMLRSISHPKYTATSAPIHWSRLVEKESDENLEHRASLSWMTWNKPKNKDHPWGLDNE